MTESSPVQPQDSHARRSKPESGNFISILKKKKRVALQDVDNPNNYDVNFIQPKNHGIKKALVERPFIADTSVILQKLIVEILHTTTEENVRELILTAMKKIKFETELFAKQVEKRIAEAEIKKKAEPYPDSEIIDPILLVNPSNSRELTEAERVKIKQRDGYTCLCCGANTEIKLQISHIKPLSIGGGTSVENSQTLCITCYRCQGNNEMDFRCNTTKLSIPENLDLSLRTESQYSIRTLTRIVNLFYHCKAVCKIKWEVHIYAYNIYLYPNNNPEWLLKHKAELLRFIQGKLGRNAYHILVTAIE